MTDDVELTCSPFALPIKSHSRQPESISELAELTGRKQSNLSWTLKTMSQYGLVEIVRENRQVKPMVKATEFQIITA